MTYKWSVWLVWWLSDRLADLSVFRLYLCTEDPRSNILDLLVRTLRTISLSSSSVSVVERIFAAINRNRTTDNKTATMNKFLSFLVAVLVVVQASAFMGTPVLSQQRNVRISLALNCRTNECVERLVMYAWWVYWLQRRLGKGMDWTSGGIQNCLKQRICLWEMEWMSLSFLLLESLVENAHQSSTLDLRVDS